LVAGTGKHLLRGLDIEEQTARQAIARAASSDENGEAISSDVFFLPNDPWCLPWDSGRPGLRSQMRWEDWALRHCSQRAAWSGGASVPGFLGGALACPGKSRARPWYPVPPWATGPGAPDLHLSAVDAEHDALGGRVGEDIARVRSRSPLLPGTAKLRAASSGPGWR
jgi:hypothetical protein